MLPLFALTIFLGAALLFIAEPMAAKLVLPLLGGSPAVWNTCMAFFQAALLGGYLGAHLLSRLRPRVQVTIYLAVLAGLLLISTFAGRLIVGTPGQTPPPTAGSPIPWLLAALAIIVGPPFLIVSCAAPLLQRWFADSSHHSAKDPYFLYAASNAGSLVGLLGYPTLIEPWLTLTGQRRVWSIAFGLFAILAAACALSLRRSVPSLTAPATIDGAKRKTPWLTRFFWLALAAIPSSLVLGVTQHLSTDIAAVPLLWVIPLALYLLTFIIAFSGRPIPVVSLSKLLPLLAVSLAIVALTDARNPVWVIILLHLMGLFGCALLCHTRLAAARPDPSRLTEFYLAIALGGVLGGMFNALLAPVLFNSVIEYPLALSLSLLFLVPRQGPRPAWTPARIALAVAIPIFAVTLAFCAEALQLRRTPGSYVQLAIGVGIPALGAYLVSRIPVSFAFAIAGMLLAAVHLANVNYANFRQVRTFFGVYRVSRYGNITNLVHGSTAHGLQYRDQARRDQPLGYYHREGPIGDVFSVFKDQPLFDRIGLVGLGTGALAAYGRPGQEITFHEIDPAVIAIATDEACFSYLKDCKAHVTFAVGDGRLTMARVPDGQYGLVLLDAFSSDAIPIHLITREAVQVYLAKLRPHGLIAFHISNHYLDLAPVLSRLGAELGLATLHRLQEFDPDQERAVFDEKGLYGSQWVLLAREASDFGPLTGNKEWKPLKPAPRGPLWTDDYSNILSVFQWREPG